MIRSFANAQTQSFYTTGRSRHWPTDILKRAAMRLLQIDSATKVDDLRLPPSNHLEALKGRRLGQWSVRINQQWRICFEFANGDADQVEIVDYH